MAADWDWTAPHKCPVCGKVFFVTSRTEWVYKRVYDSKPVYICGWSCLRKHDAEKEKEKLDKLINRGRKRA